MITLALDLSTHVGWACGVPGAEPDGGDVDLPSGSGRHGAMGAALLDLLADLHAVQHFDRIVVEAPLPPAAQTSANTARIQFGLAFVVEVFGFRRAIPVREARADEVRLCMLGRARPAKGEIIAWCRARGWSPSTHNVADAMALLAYAHHVDAGGVVALPARPVRPPRAFRPRRRA